MGYELYREVKVWAPDSLTHREKLTALVLADDANDRSRLTYNSVVDPEIMRQSLVKNKRDMLKILARLTDEKVIEHAGGGHNGRVAKYRFLYLAPVSIGALKPGENHPPTSVKGVQNDPPTPDVGSANQTPNSPEGREGGVQNEHPSDGEGCSNRPGRVSKKNTPTPSPSSNTSSSPAAGPGSEAHVQDGGGGGQQDDKHVAAAAFLRDLPDPWTAGKISARELAPLLVEVMDDTGWQLDDDLVAQLTRNPGGIRDHLAVLGKRIGDLPKRIAAKATAEKPLPEWCGNCEGPSRDERWRGSRRCPDCHPASAAADAA
ncbi:hypothetical protein AB0J30_08845 [Streptomyces microflavus]|uniref:hypothetical protein n=1 Tax=Streptomyces microflavus TaxID=1919 RepID=UPI0034484141